MHCMTAGNYNFMAVETYSDFYSFFTDSTRAAPLLTHLGTTAHPLTGFPPGITAVHTNKETQRA